MKEHRPLTQNGVIFRPEYELFGYQGWPTVCKDETGALYAVWSGFRVQHIGPFGKTAMSFSTDGGRSWSCPMIVNDTPLDDRDAGILALGGGKMLLSWFTHYADDYLEGMNGWILSSALEEDKPMLQAGLERFRLLPPEQKAGSSYLRLSENRGLNWSEKIPVPVSTPHGPILRSDGSLLYFGKVLEYRLRGGEHWPIAAYRSEDGGHTWQLLGEVPLPEGIVYHNFQEPYALELPDGSLLGAIRVEGETLDPQFTIYLTRSSDGGRTWSTPEPTGFFGSPPHLLLHSSGAVICTYGRRTAPFGQRAAVSYDNGKTWGDEYVLCDQLPDNDLGYPSTVELEDGTLFTVYYQKCPGDRKTSIQYTRWRLDEQAP